MDLKTDEFLLTSAETGIATALTGPSQRPRPTSPGRGDGQEGVARSSSEAALRWRHHHERAARDTDGDSAGVVVREDTRVEEGG